MPEFTVYQQKFDVSFEYPVYFTRDVFGPGNDLLAGIIRNGPDMPAKAVVCIDAGVADATPGLVDTINRYFEDRNPSIVLAHKPLILPGGEHAKNGWNGVRQVMSLLGESHLCRHSYVVGIGGGSFLDMTGFAASLVHRGLRMIRLPTTVLGQNDAGVGVKTGMNEHGAKNFAGTFAPPFAVIDDFNFLTTLDDREWVGGIAEAFKVAIIKDAAFFDFLCDNAANLRARDMPAMEELIRRCAILHLEHIRTAGDPFEFGRARPLDFGHWAAHKLECMSEFAIGHGQAVAIGIALDSLYATAKGLLSRIDSNRILDGLQKSGLPLWSPFLDRRSPAQRLEIIDGLDQFREHLGGRLAVTLPSGIGNRVEVDRMDEQCIVDSLAILRAHEEHQHHAPAR